jgi:putative tryptophan/tyrosine transport system substrate-binding protein
MNRAAAQALIVLTDPILFSQRKRIVDLASKYKLPAVYFFQGFVEEGGLMSYGPSDATFSAAPQGMSTGIEGCEA